MTVAHFEDHPTDPDKVILRKPRLDQGPDYERGFIDGMQHQMQSSVDKAVNRMAQPEQEPVRITGFDCVCGRRMVVSAEQGVVPAPQRTWVGLTDEELNEAMHYWSDDSRSAYGGAYAADGEYVDMRDTWRYIEAKLKEKNNV